MTRRGGRVVARVDRRPGRRLQRVRVQQGRRGGDRAGGGLRGRTRRARTSWRARAPRRARCSCTSRPTTCSTARRRARTSRTTRPRPLGVYGASKLAGELAGRVAAPSLIVRTSGVLGAGGSRGKGGSFVERILARARSGQPLRVVDDQTFAPTFASDLAVGARRARRRGRARPRTTSRTRAPARGTSWRRRRSSWPACPFPSRRSRPRPSASPRAGPRSPCSTARATARSACRRCRPGATPCAVSSPRLTPAAPLS